MLGCAFFDLRFETIETNGGLSLSSRPIGSSFDILFCGRVLRDVAPISPYGKGMIGIGIFPLRTAECDDILTTEAVG